MFVLQISFREIFECFLNTLENVFETATNEYCICLLFKRKNPKQYLNEICLAKKAMEKKNNIK
uniref:Uncharacterized protein n=1 Tax=Octopus bimaculoides TaxID=37653 RepID=A0A0L8GZ07_OCTBM